MRSACSLLAHHFLSRFVFAQSFERCLPHQFVRGPRSKCNLSYELWLDPSRIPPRLNWQFCKWRILFEQLVEPVTQQAVRLPCEPRPRAAGIDQLAILVITEKQGSDTMSAFGRR